MNQREAKIKSMIEEAKRLELDISDELIEKVVIGLGPSVYIRIVSLYPVARRANWRQLERTF